MIDGEPDIAVALNATVTEDSSSLQSLIVTLENPLEEDSETLTVDDNQIPVTITAQLVSTCRNLMHYSLKLNLL